MYGPERQIGATIERPLGWRPFCPYANYTIPLPSGSSSQSVGGKTRRQRFGGLAPIVHADGATGISTVQHSGLTRNASTIESTYPNGESDHWEKRGDLWRIAYNTGEALTSSAARCQLSCYPLPLGLHRWDIAVQFGDDANTWSLPASGNSPVLFWQLKPTSGQPSMSLTVDTDSTDGTKIEIFLAHKATAAGAVSRLFTQRGLSRHTMYRMTVEALLSYGSDGWVRWSLNGSPLHGSSRNTLISDATGLHQTIWGIYAYNNTDPGTAPTRITWWKQMEQWRLHTPEQNALSTWR